jgi:hypothetical protein
MSAKRQRDITINVICRFPDDDPRTRFKACNGSFKFPDADKVILLDMASIFTDVGFLRSGSKIPLMDPSMELYDGITLEIFSWSSDECERQKEFQLAIARCDKELLREAAIACKKQRRVIKQLQEKVQKKLGE